MDIGKQIRQLRTQRGVTQEALAQEMNCSAQAVSKWERGETTPDISLLPALSAYFGVTIDELFALSDQTRIQRIENMLWTRRELDPADVNSAADFLLTKAHDEPENGEPYRLLAEMELHISDSHLARAEDYAHQALLRQPELRDAHAALVKAMGGKCPDWNVSNHCRLIEYYKDFVAHCPRCRVAYLWLMDQLLDDYRFDEAEAYCAMLEENCPDTNRAALYRGIIAWYRGRRDEAMEIWEAMDMDGDEAWLKQLNTADFLARAGRFEEAKSRYARAFELQAKPRYSDAPESIAQICQLQGDYPGAIAALETKLRLLAEEWDCTEGDEVDALRRRIDKLREKI